MVQRIFMIALASGTFAMGIFSAGSPGATSITLGLLAFLSGITVIISWEAVKRSIIEQMAREHTLSIPRCRHSDKLASSLLGSGRGAIRAPIGFGAGEDPREEDHATFEENHTTPAHDAVVETRV